MHWAVTHPRWTRWRSGERPRLPPKGPGLNLVRTYCFFHWPQVLPLQLPPSATTPTGDKQIRSQFMSILCVPSLHMPDDPPCVLWMEYETGILFHSSARKVKSSSAFWSWGVRRLSARLRTAYKFLRQFISDDIAGHSSTGTLFRRSYSAAMRARCGGALSCWRMADLLFLMYGITC